MSFDADQLYRLLPAIHRIRDAELGAALAREKNDPGHPERYGPLRALIDALSGQVAVVEEHLEQLYDNHFVETAAPWALPYLSDLLGIRGLPPLPALGGMVRAEVGHTMAYRRRKGTAAMLEQLARDATQWPARAVEFFERIAASQHLNHVRPGNAAWASLRRADALELTGTPFERPNRTVEVRRIASGGRWNIPNIGLFVWRLETFPLTRSPLTPASDAGGWPAGAAPVDRCFHLHPLRWRAPLITNPETEGEVEHLASPEDVPLPITRRNLADHSDAKADAALTSYPPRAALYGEGKSVMLWEVKDGAVVAIPARDWSKDPSEARVVVADLSTWKGIPDRIALDPVLGRVVLPKSDQAFAKVGKIETPQLLVTRHYSFSARIGGGEYERTTSFERRSLEDVISVSQLPREAGALPVTTVQLLPALALLNDQNPIVEIQDSGVYRELLAIDAGRHSFELRAADGTRPSVVFQPEPGKPAAVTLQGGKNGKITLNGLWLASAPLVVPADSDPDAKSPVELGQLEIRHCTHVPVSPAKKPRPEPACGPSISLRVEARAATVEISDSLLGAIRVSADTRVRLRNCIIDARGRDRQALGGLKDGEKAGIWELSNCTIIGTVHLRILDLASNTIFLGDDVSVQQQQRGCVRYSWLPFGAITPRRHECLAGAEDGVDEPVFTSLRLCDAAYGQLRRANATAILHGADDGSEMGAFHDLFQPQREAHLRTRLEEHLRFGLEAGLFFMT